MSNAGLDTDLVEPHRIDDLYADARADYVHDLGATFRTIFFTWQIDPATGLFERHVVLKLIRPKSGLKNLEGPLARQLDMRGIIHRAPRTLYNGNEH